jgi:nucleosome binding factor SPN SPT16 subunit
LTEGVKSAKRVMFFLNSESDQDVKPASKAKKAPKAVPNGNPSPLKNKTAGGKVLRNKTRGAAQAESMQSASQKIAEHQAELHTQLQKEGLAKYSEAGEGSGGKEGQGWKKFQSYKGEAALPKEVESLRVRVLFPCCYIVLILH